MTASKDPAERSATRIWQEIVLGRGDMFEDPTQCLRARAIIREEYAKEPPRFDCPNSRKLLDTWKRRRGDLELLINDLKDDLDEFDGMIEMLKESIRGHENDQD